MNRENNHFLKKNTLASFIYLVAILLSSEKAIANENMGTVAIKPSAMSQAWESARDGALIGFGTGAAVSLIGYSAGSDMAYGRVLAGSTGTGFIVGAVYGFFENRFFDRSSDVAENRRFKLQPQYFTTDNKNGYGLFAQMNF